MEAKTIGLFDEVGTMESVIGACGKMKEFNFEPRDEGFGSLRGQFFGAILSTLGDFHARAPLQFK